MKTDFMSNNSLVSMPISMDSLKRICLTFLFFSRISPHMMIMKAHTNCKPRSLHESSKIAVITFDCTYHLIVLHLIVDCSSTSSFGYEFLEFPTLLIIRENLSWRLVSINKFAYKLSFEMSHIFPDGDLVFDPITHMVRLTDDHFLPYSDMVIDLSSLEGFRVSYS